MQTLTHNHVEAEKAGRRDAGPERRTENSELKKLGKWTKVGDNFQANAETWNYGARNDRTFAYKELKDRL